MIPTTATLMRWVIDMLWIYLVGQTGFNKERKRELRNILIVWGILCVCALSIDAMGC